jgi:hypothetical protein
VTIAILQSIARPVAICLVAGGLRFLQDYQQTGKLTPSLIDGAIVAAYAAAAFLGVNGVQSGVAGARTAMAAKPSAGKLSP